MDTTTMILLALAVLVILALLALLTIQRQQSAKIRERFGPEYEHAVQEYGDKHQAEKELAAREKRVAKLNIHPLSPEQHNRFTEAWRNTQAHFVDAPADAVTEADRLVNEVMQARGYPMGNFEQRVADISVDHANVVTNYRAACEIADANRKGKASTEDLRKAMVYYRSLFNELLESAEPPTEKVKEIAR